MKKTLERCKNTTHPTTDHTLNDICEKFKQIKIMEKYGYDSEGREKFYVGTEITTNYGFTVFKSQYVVNFIKAKIIPTSRRYMMDGTFDSLPKGFYQLIIIAVEYHNEVSESLFSCAFVSTSLKRYCR